MTSRTAPSATPVADPQQQPGAATTPDRRCREHGVDAVYDVDCFRCPADNAVVGPPVR